MVVASLVRVEKWWTEASGLRPVTFDLVGGELVVVRGRSGSGKSTLLALLAGWCTPDGGELRYADGVTPERWQSVAAVPQVLALVADLTIGENVELAAEPGHAAHLVRELDLVEMATRLPAETSMGQQQRAAVARAAAARPALMLADEPTSHQDPGHVEAVLRVLRATADSGTAVLVATHEEAVVAAADRVIDLEV